MLCYILQKGTMQLLISGEAPAAMQSGGSSVISEAPITLRLLMLVAPLIVAASLPTSLLGLSQLLKTGIWHSLHVR